LGLHNHAEDALFLDAIEDPALRALYVPGGRAAFSGVGRRLGGDSGTAAEAEQPPRQRQRVEPADEDEEEELQRALKLSAQQANQARRALAAAGEDEELQRALELSAREASAAAAPALPAGASEVVDLTGDSD
jgi:hypothetical protein